MRKKVSIALLLVFMLAFTSVLSGCNTNTNTNTTASTVNTTANVETTEPAAPVRDDLNVALEVPISSLEPTALLGNGSIVMLRSIYGTLVDLDEEMNVIPSIAESWTKSEDGLTYTFKIREGIKFSNGDELTAEDVVFSFERFLKAPIGQFYSQYISGASALDKFTVEVKTPAVFEGIYTALSTVLLVLPKNYVESMSDDISQKAIGSGPYIVKNFEPGSHIDLEANENYFKGAPSIKTITMKFIPDAGTRAIALESGEVDLIMLPAFNDRSNLMNLDHISYLEALSNKRYIISLSDFGILKDSKLREAISYGINSEEIFQVMTDGVGQVIKGTVSPVAFPQYSDIVEISTYNPEQAKIALAESEYDPTSDVVVISVLDPVTQRIAEVIQNQLSQVGIKTQIDTIEVGAFYGRIAEGKIEIAISFGGGSVFSPQEELGGFTTMQDRAQRWPDSQQMDDLYNQLIATADQNQRTEIITEMYGVLRDMYLVIPLYVTNEAIAFDKGLNGIKSHPEGIYIFENSNW